MGGGKAVFDRLVRRSAKAGLLLGQPCQMLGMSFAGVGDGLDDVVDLSLGERTQGFCASLAVRTRLRTAWMDCKSRSVISTGRPPIHVRMGCWI